MERGRCECLESSLLSIEYQASPTVRERLVIGRRRTGGQVIDRTSIFELPSTPLSRPVSTSSRSHPILCT